MRNYDVIGLHHGFFADFGFEFHPSKFIYQKDLPWGQQVVFVQFTEYPEVNYLEYKLGVRIHQVEEIIHLFLPTLADYAERSITLIQTPDKIGKQIPARFVLENDSQLAEAIMAGETFFVTHGFYWLDQMIDPVKLEKAFAERKEKSFRCHNFVYNCFRGVTLARLYNPNDYQFLRNIYLKEIENRHLTPFNIGSFLQLLNYLDELEINSSFSHL